jgi:hypothetical protein
MQGYLYSHIKCCRKSSTAKICRKWKKPTPRMEEHTDRIHKISSWNRRTHIKNEINPIP